jgi:SNF2 family DNA or RNA helicase
MKTTGMKHQLEALRRMNGARWFGLFMEQGTGKTWTFLADIERYYIAGKIDAALIAAPSGVHENWVLREIPLHLEVPHVAKAWRAGMGKRERAQFERDLLTPARDGEPRPLRILAINYEAIARSKEALAFVLSFLNCTRAIFVCDESQRIKNPKSKTYEKVMAARPHAVARRIGTGTPIDKPQDIFAQMEFLESGLLGTDNYRAFMAEYAVLVDPRNPRTQEDWAMARRMQANPRMAFATIVARDEHTGLPMYRNLDRLRGFIAPHSYRVLKKDCLDLPPKVYQNHYFEMTSKQREAYERMETELRIQTQDGELTPVHALAKFGKLQQITSGFVFVPGQDEPMYIESENPRILSIVDRLEDIPGQKIVWARFREEIRALGNAFRDLNIPFVEYHGGIKKGERNESIDKFQGGEAEILLGVQKAGGVGLTLTAAATTIFCSNEFSALVRMQAEDRNHRKGSEIHDSILYIDSVARDSIDESIARAHQFKLSLAETIMGDRGIDLRGVGFEEQDEAAILV